MSISISFHLLVVDISCSIPYKIVGYAGVNGGYSYVDAAGKLQTVSYVADGAGFRVEDSRLPVFNPEPLVAPTFNPVSLFFV